jgi:hypothetical protein
VQTREHERGSDAASVDGCRQPGCVETAGRVQTLQEEKRALENRHREMDNELKVACYELNQVGARYYLNARVFSLRATCTCMHGRPRAELPVPWSKHYSRL